MEIFVFLLLWCMAVSFNLLIISLLISLFIKGHKAKLHYFGEYSEPTPDMPFNQKQKASHSRS